MLPGTRCIIDNAVESWTSDFNKEQCWSSLFHTLLAESADIHPAASRGIRLNIQPGIYSNSGVAVSVPVGFQTDSRLSCRDQYCRETYTDYFYFKVH